MISLSEIEQGRIIYDFIQCKSLEFVYGGNTDYYFRIQIYAGGKITKDKSLTFVIDKSNIDFYNTFANFFNSVKTATLAFKAGKRKINIPHYPALFEVSYPSEYDINELYDEESNTIKWKSEEGNREVNLNADTIMFIEGSDNEFRIIFKNDELFKINERMPRNVCVCNSGSNSSIFPVLSWAFDQELRKLPIVINKEEAHTKILKK